MYMYTIFYKLFIEKQTNKFFIVFDVIQYIVV